jgi:hypothetical protein
VLLLAASAVPYAGLALVVQAVAAIAALGLALVLLGGFLNLKWACSVCRQPIAGRSVHICPSCHASFT